MKNLVYVAVLALIFSACKKDDGLECPDGQVEVHGHCHDAQELITSVELIFGDQTFAFRDTDGAGGNPAIVDDIVLEASSDYEVQVRVLNESEDPVEDVTLEIQEEADHHQLFYFAEGAEITHEYLDEDSDGQPLGLSMRFTTASASTGTLRVVLKHIQGVKDGNPDTGETDIDVTFQVEIQ